MADNFKDLDVSYTTHLPLNKGAKILDFGCGTGRMLKYLYQQGYTNLHGADIDNTEFINLNKLNIATFKIVDSQLFLRSVENTFDFIIAKDVVYYFDSNEIKIIFLLLQKALLQNGKIIFEVFNGATLTGPYIKYKDIGIQLILTEHSLKSLIKLSDLKLDYIGGNKRLITGGWSLIFYIFHFFEKFKLKILYFSERGIDNQNPKIFTRKILATAFKQ